MIFGGTLAVVELHRLQKDLFTKDGVESHDVDSCSGCKLDVWFHLHDWLTDQAIRQGLTDGPLVGDFDAGS